MHLIGEGLPVWFSAVKVLNPAPEGGTNRAAPPDASL